MWGPDEPCEGMREPLWNT